MRLYNDESEALTDSPGCAVILFDCDGNRALVRENERVIRPVASLTKLATALAVLECVLEKNPKVRIVVTAATLETLQETLRAAESLCLRAEYTQVAATRIIRRGEYHMMNAQNPVWVISMEKDT